MVTPNTPDVLSGDRDTDEGQLTFTQVLAPAREQTLGHIMNLMEDLLAIDNTNLKDNEVIEDFYNEVRSDSLYQRRFQIVSDTSFFDTGFLGQAGQLPDWPGEDAYPPQPMNAQTRDILGAYADAGGTYQEERFEDVGHSPHIERPERFRSTLLEFLAD